MAVPQIPVLSGPHETLSQKVKPNPSPQTAVEPGLTTISTTLGQRQRCWRRFKTIRTYTSSRLARAPRRDLLSSARRLASPHSPSNPPGFGPPVTTTGACTQAFAPAHLTPLTWLLLPPEKQLTESRGPGRRGPGRHGAHTGTGLLPHRCGSDFRSPAFQAGTFAQR